MREISTHSVNDCNDALKIEVLDKPGNGGACHEYKISGFKDAVEPLGIPSELVLNFQFGPIAECGVNGITHEALLAVLIDRLEGFQSGDFKCFENERALNHLRDALGWLHLRTEKRITRGVEGTHQK